MLVLHILTDIRFTEASKARIWYGKLGSKFHTSNPHRCSCKLHSVLNLLASLEHNKLHQLTSMVFLIIGIILLLMWCKRACTKGWLLCRAIVQLCRERVGNWFHHDASRRWEHLISVVLFSVCVCVFIGEGVFAILDCNSSKSSIK